MVGFLKENVVGDNCKALIIDENKLINIFITVNGNIKIQFYEKNGEFIYL
jgi:hypothetical protein